MVSSIIEQLNEDTFIAKVNGRRYYSIIEVRECYLKRDWQDFMRPCFGKKENVKVLAEDMQRYISEKQVEVSDYGNYLNRAYNRLMQGKGGGI